MTLTPPVRVSEPALPWPPGPPSWKAGTAEGDPDGINALCAALKRAGDAWIAAGQEISRHLATIGAPTGPAQRLRRAGADLLTEIPGLHRRRDLLLASDPSRAAWVRTADTLMKALMTGDRALYTTLVEQGLHPMDIPRSDPSAAATWWKALTPRQRSLYTRAFPSTIGWTDGLPAQARDKANRQTLQTRLKHLQSRLPESLTPFEKRDLSRLRALAEVLDAASRQADTEILLLGLDSTNSGEWDKMSKFVPYGDKVPKFVADSTPGSDGRVIISIGNPDRSSHIATFVPGTTAQLDAISGDVDRSVSLWRQGKSYGYAGDPSVIMWLGYDAPDGIVADAPRAMYAEKASPKLVEFINGLRSAHNNERPHITAVGHSYGSVVVGDAARGGRLSVDDIIVAGSPGMRVGSAEELGIGAEHVWAEEAYGDAVPDIGKFGHGRPNRENFWSLDFHPIAPADAEFGGNVLATDTQGHSDYWRRDTVSLDNQARVFMGTYENSVVIDDPELEASSD
ncbi:alpha/beta hydrolase [Actinocorallia aurea]